MAASLMLRGLFQVLYFAGGRPAKNLMEEILQLEFGTGIWWVYTIYGLKTNPQALKKTKKRYLLVDLNKKITNIYMLLH